MLVLVLVLVVVVVVGRGGVIWCMMDDSCGMWDVDVEINEVVIYGMV